jgi:hypothetical protein
VPPVRGCGYDCADRSAICRSLSLLEQTADARAVGDAYVAGSHEQTLADTVILPAGLAEVALGEGRLRQAEIFAHSAIRRAGVDQQVPYTEAKPRYVRGVVHSRAQSVGRGRR